MPCDDFKGVYNESVLHVKKRNTYFWYLGGDSEGLVKVWEKRGEGGGGEGEGKWTSLMDYEGSCVH